MNKLFVTIVLLSAMVGVGCSDIEVDAGKVGTNKSPIEVVVKSEEVELVKGKLNSLTVTQLEEIKDEDYFILFSHPGCGFCVKLETDFLPEYLKREDSQLIVKIDLSRKENEDAWKTFNIPGVPFMYKVTGGEVSDEAAGFNTIQDMLD